MIIHFFGKKHWQFGYRYAACSAWKTYYDTLQSCVTERMHFWYQDTKAEMSLGLMKTSFIFYFALND